MAASTFIDLTGFIFGRWTVLYVVQRHPGRYLCRCTCGVERIIWVSSLRNGKSKSCGCLMLEIQKRIHCKGTNEAALNRLIRQYKGSATQRGLVWELEREDVFKICRSNCHYCGVAPYQFIVGWRDGFHYNGIDRFDNTKGYQLDNCVPCCFMCNRAKDHHTVDKFRQWLERIAKHQGLSVKA